MSDPAYTVFIRVPMPRGDFVDPPQVKWDSNKDESLWRILSGAAKTEIDWNEVADRFDVPVDFLLQQVAYLTERHASQVRAQVRKATAAARGSAAPSPIPGADSAGPGHQRAPSSLSVRRESPMPRNELGSGAGTPLNSSMRPIVSRNPSTNTTVLRDMAGGSASPRPTGPIPMMTGRAGERRRLSSLPITSNSAKSPQRDAERPHSPAPEGSPSPGPAEDSSTATSDDESSPAQSRIIRRPPRFQQHDAAPSYEDDEDDESEPAFQPYKAPDQAQTSDLGSTLRGEGRASKKLPRSLGKALYQSQTSDSSASSAAMVQRPSQSRDQRQPGPLSPRQAEVAAQSPGSKSRGYSREGSDGTPSMGSSFSDLDGRLSILFTMFYRRWSGLPRDVEFPPTLDGLGYFVNDQDEIRSIENPDCYFKFFLNKNLRINECQRFAFNGAMEKVIHDRLKKQGLEVMALPRDSLPSEKHTTIFTTPNLASYSRIIVILGEPTQDLGILAGRVANGPGGLTKGSMVSVVDAIRETAAASSSLSPGIILANMGQRFWWPKGKRALTISASADTPLPSLVHSGTKYVPALNDIPGSETALRHLGTVFNDVIGNLPNNDIKIDVIAIGESCDIIERFFDDEGNWSTWSSRLSAMVLLGTVFETSHLSNDAFKKFLAQRSRGYLLSGEPLDTPLAPPEGNPSLAIQSLGCPCYSSSEAQYTEVIAIRAIESVLGYLEDVSTTASFVNPPIIVIDRPTEQMAQDEWDNLNENDKPIVQKVDNEAMIKQVKDLRYWRKFEQTGEAPESDSDGEQDENQDGNKLDTKEAW
ncbi:Arb2 domain-containing protein [Mariannaea sp. PMI_226]|nr:Arb2 domain-containing protein [Mariannaea sp. PMI_226]